MAAFGGSEACGQAGDDRRRMESRAARHPGSGTRALLNRAATLEPMAESRTAISELTRDQLVVWLDKHGEPAYRAKQIRRHATHGTERGVDELTDLRKSLRDSLARSFRWSSVEPVREEASADRETRKALLELRDGNNTGACSSRITAPETRCGARRRPAARMPARSEDGRGQG